MITAMPRIAIASDNFDAMVDLFRRGFGMPVLDISDSTVESLGAKLAMCVPPGGSNIELMSPAVAEAPLSISLQRFLDRRGEGPFALMLEAPSPDDEALELTARGLNVLPLMAGAGGRDVHPNSNHGVLVRVYPQGSFTGQAEENVVSPFSGIRKVIIAVTDIEAGRRTFGEKFALETEEPVEDATRGVVSCFVHPPAGGDIELVAVHNPAQPFAAAVAKRLEMGEGIYALVLTCENLEQAARRLQQADISYSREDGTLVTDASTTFGTCIRIEAEG